MLSILAIIPVKKRKVVTVEASSDEEIGEIMETGAFDDNDSRWPEEAEAGVVPCTSKQGINLTFMENGGQDKEISKFLND